MARKLRADHSSGLRATISTELLAAAPLFRFAKVPLRFTGEHILVANLDYSSIHQPGRAVVLPAAPVPDFRRTSLRMRAGGAPLSPGSSQPDQYRAREHAAQAPATAFGRQRESAPRAGGHTFVGSIAPAPNRQ
ncbi:uncharacterized protein SCHCODRAFT_02283993 [Schizophyllum commune H4-8]|uniref:uncharacterized protein n=1 Tax=Schizophyllum commune (strain H4-8 / FGSC 9210) TaxID=578458 RepID=UPI0021600DD0|nr:uncharacterized protein SCHCODRAFT_02283993 [Schizophyllum commune H4-8]KAI5892125.1 hypothetical protein SCHCODRAFT_02283993 [Schizophyllum commune H4-8]